MRNHVALEAVNSAIAPKMLLLSAAASNIRPPLTLAGRLSRASRLLHFLKILNGYYAYEDTIVRCV
jgi:hypothetical protein